MGKKGIKKNTLKYIIIGSVAALALVLVIVAIIVLPEAIITSRFGKIFNVAEDMTEPSILITDLGTDNNYSGASGEILVADGTAKYMIEQLSDMTDDFIYKGRENAAGSLDLRYKITDGETEVECYLFEEGIYYVRNGKKYVFIPEDNDTKVEYKKIYNSACLFVK